MYTIEDLEVGITRLQELKILLKKVEYYHHRSWARDCGSPSCALGWATTLYPNEIYISYDTIRSYINSRFNAIQVGEITFKITNILSHYLFNSSIPREIKLDNGCITKQFNLNRKTDNVEETLERIERVQLYLRRRLAMLLAEEESRTLTIEELVNA